MQINPQSRLQLRLQSIIFLLLFLASIMLLAWLSHQYSYRSDWTANQRNSLSDDTIKLLNNLKQPVMIRSYQLDDTGTQMAVNEILGNYQRAKNDLQYQILNPDLEISLAKADAIERYGQTVIVYNQQQEKIDELSEQTITNALLRLSREQRPLLAFVNNHGERQLDSATNTGYLQFSQELRKKGFNIKNINLLTDNIDSDINVLVIAASEHPWLDGELDKLLNFIQQGGNLFWLRDPGESSLTKLADVLQLAFTPGVVVDNNTNLRKTLGIQHPAVVPIIQYGQHAITEDMRYNTLFPIANAIETQSNSTWHSSPLLITLADSWSETDGFALDVHFDKDKGDKKGPLNLGLALQRDIASKTQRIVVLGDSDFLANSYVGAGANLLFALNIMNWLSEDDELISIAPKNAPDLKLQLTDRQILIISFGFLIILPLLLLFSGLYIWRKRKKQQ